MRYKEFAKEAAEDVNSYRPKSVGDLRSYNRGHDPKREYRRTPLKRANFDNAWHVGGNQRTMEAKLKAMLYADKHAHEEVIAFSAITTGQGMVIPAVVQKYLADPPSELAVIQRWNRHNFLFDGNHRVTAAIIRGEQEARFIVLDLWMFDAQGNLKPDWESDMPSDPGRIVESVADDAKTLFGITDNPSEAGYILADGTMLDLTGRHQVGDYIRHADGRNRLRRPGDDWLADRRFVDHREVNDLYHMGSGTLAMRRFMAEAPALRFHPGIGFEANAVPAPRQLAKAMAAHFALTSDPAAIDVSDPQSGETLASQSFNRRQIKQAAAFIAGVLAGEGPDPA